MGGTEGPEKGNRKEKHSGRGKNFTAEACGNTATPTCGCQAPWSKRGKKEARNVLDRKVPLGCGVVGVGAYGPVLIKGRKRSKKSEKRPQGRKQGNSRKGEKRIGEALS